MTGTNPCAHLGFDPAPGSTDLVRDLHRRLSNCAKEMEKAHSKVTGLMNGSYWEGDAAVAFREQLKNGPLPLNLENGAHSVHEAARQLGLWAGELGEFQRRARKLDAEAGDARAALRCAQGHADRVKKASDRKRGDTDPAPDAANGRVTAARDDLDDVLKRARCLAAEHEDTARRRARHIGDAAHRLAPHEPDAWDRFTDWLGDNLPDILSACAAVLGVIALLGLTAVAPWMLFLAAGLLSGTAFGLRVGDPELLASLKDGFSKGELDVDFWADLLGTAGDFLGILPGLGAVAKGSYLGFRAVGESGELLSLVGEGEETLTLGQRLARAGTNVGTSLETVGTSIRSEAAAAGGAASLLAHPRVFGGRLAPIVEKVDKPATIVGAGTALYGVTSSFAGTLDSDGAKTVGNLLDGPRTLGVDVPATVGALHFLLRGAGEAT
ncbi:putative T7SS-secreted protein [Streptomyces sp. NPDC093970]|uniref:putative T7SS-secreted protein n=1 Tax=Streptomyces sp. NPDC093970 TaxID=3155076 RepID=UPI003427A21B